MTAYDVAEFVSGAFSAWLTGGSPKLTYDYHLWQGLRLRLGSGWGDTLMDSFGLLVIMLHTAKKV